MGKKTRKAAAVRAAARQQAKEQADDKVGGTHTTAFQCQAGSKLQEQQHSNGTEASEFYRVASMFGIAGDRPQEGDFVHPTQLQKAGVGHEDSPIYRALCSSIIQTLEARRKRELGLIPGSRQSWENECDIMRSNALGRLRHRRKRERYKARKKCESLGCSSELTLVAIIDELD